MKICKVQGNGVCINCNTKEVLKKYNYEICRMDAEENLSLLKELLQTKLTDEQKELINEWS